MNEPSPDQIITCLFSRQQMYLIHSALAHLAATGQLEASRESATREQKNGNDLMQMPLVELLLMFQKMPDSSVARALDSECISCALVAESQQKKDYAECESIDWFLGWNEACKQIETAILARYGKTEKGSESDEEKRVDPDTAYKMAEEIQSISHMHLEITIDYWIAFCLIGALQIGLSHPRLGTDTHGARKVLEFARNLSLGFEGLAPTCKKIIDEGWEQAERNNPGIGETSKNDHIN